MHVYVRIPEFAGSLSVQISDKLIGKNYRF